MNVPSMFSSKSGPRVFASGFSTQQLYKNHPMGFDRVFPYNNHTTTIQQLYNNPYNNPYNKSYSLGNIHFREVCFFKRKLYLKSFLYMHTRRNTFSRGNMSCCMGCCMGCCIVVVWLLYGCCMGKPERKPLAMICLETCLRIDYC